MVSSVLRPWARTARPWASAVIAQDLLSRLFPRHRVVRGLVLLSFALSFAAARWQALAGLSSGVKTILLTVVISLGAALLFPVEEGEEAAP